MVIARARIWSIVGPSARVFGANMAAHLVRDALDGRSRRWPISVPPRIVSGQMISQCIDLLIDGAAIDPPPDFGVRRSHRESPHHSPTS
jgi:hypothetical protein